MKINKSEKLEVGTKTRERWSERPIDFFELLVHWGFTTENAARFKEGEFKEIVCAAYLSLEGRLGNYEEWLQFIREIFEGQVDPVQYFERVRDLIKERLKEGYPKEWFLEVIGDEREE
jgi:hypothetical protein